MFTKWKRLAAIFAAIVLPISAALWSAVLSKLLPATGSPQGSIWQTYLPYLYVGLICVLSAGAAYFNHYKPARDLEKPLLRFLDVLAEGPLRMGSKYGIEPRMNIMIVYRPWYLLWKRRIRVVWGVNMDSYPDVRFSCWWDQGVSGLALKRKLPVLADCSVADKSAFKFSQKQLDDTSHVTAVWSWPIYQTNAQGKQTGAVTAVLNFDCTATGAFQKLQTNTLAFEKAMKKFTEIVSTIV